MTTKKAALFIIVVAGGIMASVSSNLPGQTSGTVPFYYPGETSYDPQVAYVASGVADTGVATVSADRKYVTLDLGAVQNGFNGIQTFTFQQGGLGFVGTPTAVAGIAQIHGHPQAKTPTQAAQPQPAARANSTPASAAQTAATPQTPMSPGLAMLTTPGMTLVAPLH